MKKLAVLLFGTLMFTGCGVSKEEKALECSTSKDMSKYGYTTEYKVLSATDFGVLQNRKRVILIGKYGTEEKGFYLPVQRVCRPDHTFRGFQGQIESGNITEGDEITVVPGGEKARINSIYVGDKKERSAVKGEAVTLQLDREIDISRGSVIVKDAGIETADSLTATILWMDDTPLHNGINYFVKLGTSLIPGIVTKILYTIDVNTGKFRETDVVQKNEIAVCRISLTDRISIAKFKDHKTLGELILIDRISFATSACGVVEQYEKNGGLIGDNVTKDTRSSVLGQKAVTILFKSSQGISRTLLEKVEKKLILGGRHTYLLEADENVKENELPVIIKHLNEAGIVVLLLTHNDNQIQTLLDSKSEVTSYEKEQKHEEDIVSFVRKVSSYEYGLVKDSSFI